MKKKVNYITLVGRSEWAVVNSLWAVLHHTEVIPTEINVIYKENDKQRAEKSTEGIRSILQKKKIDADIQMHEIKDMFDIREAADKLEVICDKDEHIILDITPARKAMASGAIISGMKKDVDGVFYLYIDSVKDADKPYLDIPLPRQDLVEMIGGEHYVEG